MKNKLSLVITLVVLAMIGLLAYSAWIQTAPKPAPVFDGQRAYADVESQIAFGPRTVGSVAHEEFISWLRKDLEKSDWTVEVQETEMMGHPIKNIIAHKGESSPTILLMAHYDSRLYADNDPDPANHTQPVPGANDGASGVAVLTELARILPDDANVWLLFVDAEDNGRIDGWDWCLGSTKFVEENPDFRPQAVVLLDMIGDADLNIYMERNSDPELTKQIWDTAKMMGYEDTFIPRYKYSVTDDHIPFIEAGIPAVDIIDLDYPYWHTVSDTPDKVSADSLEKVGNTLLHWILGFE